MKLKEIMTKPVTCVSPNISLQEAANEMLKHDCGFLPIEENNKLIGVVTDRDLAIRGFAWGLNPQSTIDHVMTKTVVKLSEDQDLSKAAAVMEDKQIRRIVVTDKNDKVVGVISLGDIAQKSDGLDLGGKIIHAVSERQQQHVRTLLRL